jgi:hypothetical protein
VNLKLRSSSADRPTKALFGPLAQILAKLTGMLRTIYAMAEGAPRKAAAKPLTPEERKARHVMPDHQC